MLYKETACRKEFMRINDLLVGKGGLIKRGRSVITGSRFL